MSNPFGAYFQPQSNQPGKQPQLAPNNNNNGGGPQLHHYNAQPNPSPYQTPQDLHVSPYGGPQSVAGPSGAPSLVGGIPGGETDHTLGSAYGDHSGLSPDDNDGPDNTDSPEQRKKASLNALLAFLADPSLTLLAARPANREDARATRCGSSLKASLRLCLDVREVYSR